MTLAWSIYKSATNIANFSEALRRAWRAVKAKMALRLGRVELTFKKTDGSETTRVATAYQGEVKGTGQSSPLTVVFHSITDGGTRSFRADRLTNYKIL